MALREPAREEKRRRHGGVRRKEAAQVLSAADRGAELCACLLCGGGVRRDRRTELHVCVRSRVGGRLQVLHRLFRGGDCRCDLLGGARSDGVVERLESALRSGEVDRERIRRGDRGLSRVRDVRELSAVERAREDELLGDADRRREPSAHVLGAVDRGHQVLSCFRGFFVGACSAALHPEDLVLAVAHPGVHGQLVVAAREWLRHWSCVELAVAAGRPGPVALRGR